MTDRTFFTHCGVAVASAVLAWVAWVSPSSGKIDQTVVVVPGDAAKLTAVSWQEDKWDVQIKRAGADKLTVSITHTAKPAVDGVPASEAIAQGEDDLHFISYFIAHHSTGLQASDEFPAGIKNRTFTFGSKGSTSGRLMPEFFIREHFEEDPQKIFKRVGFSGDHSRTIALVQSGSYEVGALNFKVWENEMKAGKIDTNKVRIIWKSPTYPDYNWTIRGDVDKSFGDGFLQKVKRALLEMSDEDLLASFPRRRFIDADNSMYQPILETAMAVGIIEK